MAKTAAPKVANATVISSTDGNQPAYEQALLTGKLLVRKWWKNTNSDKEQISVQFQQEVPRKNTSSATDVSSLVADAQGISNKARPTAIFSFKAEIAENILGSSEGDCIEEGNEIFFGKVLFPNAKMVGIQVIQTFSPNEFKSDHQPVINPLTGEIKAFFGRPVYQHEELIAGEGSFTPMTAADAEEINEAESFN